MGAKDLPGGRPREPQVLLDQLRLRLEQLDANHPSAPPERVAGEPAEADDNDEADDGDEAGQAADESGAGGQSRAGWPAGPSGSAGDGRGPRGPGGGPADLTGAVRPSEPYRPWFMSGEDGVPWFAGE